LKENNQDYLDRGLKVLQKRQKKSMKYKKEKSKAYNKDEIVTEDIMIEDVKRGNKNVMSEFNKDSYLNGRKRKSKYHYLALIFLVRFNQKFMFSVFVTLILFNLVSIITEFSYYASSECN
jgi:hypothetical protein